MCDALVIFIIALGLSGCIGAPYKPSSQHGELGYSAEPIDAKRWFVTYEASVGTLACIGESRLARRATELCRGSFKRLDPATLGDDVPYYIRGCDAPGHVGCETLLYEAWIECGAP